MKSMYRTQPTPPAPDPAAAEVEEEPRQRAPLLRRIVAWLASAMRMTNIG